MFLDQHDSSTRHLLQPSSDRKADRAGANDGVREISRPDGGRREVSVC
jgi:hypothetical protein